LARGTVGQSGSAETVEEGIQRVYSQVANRLADFIDDVYAVSIDRDERRQLLTLYVTDRDGTSDPARALSDGTLRFLALAVIELDPEAEGVLCLEEPENGIHPDRIPAMLRLLQDIATNVQEPLGPDNPLRQVLINTHAPAVVGQVPDDSLLVAELAEMVVSQRRCKGVRFSGLPDTWRNKAGGPGHAVPRSKLLSYLNPVPREPVESTGNGRRSASLRGRAGDSRARRVVDRPDLQFMLPFSADSE
jgi:hypothetical protein